MTRGIAKLADVEAIETRTRPADLPNDTYQLLQRTAEQHPDAPALSFFRVAADYASPKTWSYRQLFADVTRAANAFHALGARKGSVIAIVLPNVPEMHLATWGGQAAGIVAPINYLLSPEAIVDLLETTRARILVTAVPAGGLDLWTALLPRLRRLRDLRHVLLVGQSDLGTACLQRRAGSSDAPRHDLPFEVGDFATHLARQPADRLVGERKIAPEDFSSFLCTGGTTGAPKVAMRRHRNEVANAWSTSQCLGDAMAPGKRVFCGLPLFHANGLMVTGLLPFLTGAHVILGTPFGYRSPGLIDNFWRIVDHYRINFFSAVPTVFGTLLQVSREGRRLDSLEYGLCGAAPMPRDLLLRFEQETGLRILEGYGLTEGTCVSSLNPPRGERRPGSIGLRLPGQGMKIVLLDASGVFQREARDDEPGRVVISGPNVFAGYLAPHQDRAAWVDCGDGPRWLDTGDLGYRDTEGYFWLTGRAKDLIIRGGHNIDPAAIEQPLYAHPGVQLAAAVGRPDAHSGEVPVVYVQRRPGHAVTRAELQDLLDKGIQERAALPKEAILVDALPLTAVGKLNKVELRHWQAEYAIREALALAGLSLRSLRIDPDVDGKGARAVIGMADPSSHGEAARVLAWFPLRCEIA